MERRIINVAGKFFIDPALSVGSKRERAAIELHHILFSILTREESARECRKNKKRVARILENARLKGNVLRFSFPGHIAKEMVLDDYYEVTLVPGRPTIQILPRIANHIFLCECDIKFKGMPKRETKRLRGRIKEMLVEINKESSISGLKAFNLSVYCGRYTIKLRFCDNRGTEKFANYGELEKILKDAKKFLR